MKQEAEQISDVVHAFYDKAKSDIIIGYHFRHIKDFDEHIPKISRFWVLQLLKLSKDEIKNLQEEGIPNQIIKKHIYLKIKKGEVGRWVLLFQETIDHSELDSDLATKWKSIVLKWKKNFLESKELFD